MAPTQVGPWLQQLRGQRESHRGDISHPDEPRDVDTLAPVGGSGKAAMRGREILVLSENGEKRLQLGRVIWGLLRHSGSRHDDMCSGRYVGRVTEC